MATVFVGGELFFCDALARRLKPLRDEGLIELLDDPSIAEGKLDRLRKGEGIAFAGQRLDAAGRADIVVLLMDEADFDPRMPLGRAFEAARERARLHSAALIVVLESPFPASDTRLAGVNVVPAVDQGWRTARDPEVFLAQIVAAVRVIASGPPGARINRLQLTNFTAFRNLDISFVPGINVFIGPNSSGKTHVLKVLYAAMSTMDRLWREAPFRAPNKRVADFLALKLIDVFKPADGELKRVISKCGDDQLLAAVRIATTDSLVEAELSPSGWVTVSSHELVHAKQPVFIPSREGLSLFEGFQALYLKHELTIDGTYNDLCVALDAPPLQAPRAEGAGALVGELNGRMMGAVVRRGGRFVLSTAQGEIEANLLAEGLRKLATLARLLENGSLGSESVLFWDEPEANLNPLLIKPMVALLQKLAQLGVQIFVATHDYLFAYRMSLAAQYATTEGLEYRFFSFSRPDPEGPVSVETGDTMADLEQSPILDELLAFYDERSELFARSMRESAESVDDNDNR